MYLNKIEDPRDALQKAKRPELIQHARAHNVSEIHPEMPAIMMRQILRSKGLTRINLPPRPLGAPLGPAVTSDQGATVDADADLARQWQQQKTEPVETQSLASMGINELRKECQRLEIKLARTANMKSMRELIEAKRNG